MSDDLQSIAVRHGVSEGAAAVVYAALHRTSGRQAQFSHPELGGMGQWMPGMVMVGDMFNHALKARVDALCRDLAALILAESATAAPAAFTSPPVPARWWPADLGDSPNTAGTQNGGRYAYFAAAGRLAVEQGGAVAVFDTGGRRIVGVSQQQTGGAPGTLTFRDDQGLSVELASLRRVA